MKGFIKSFVSNFAIFAASAAVLTLAPSLSYGGLLGTTAGGTLNVALSPKNYFDLAASPGTAPVNQTVVDPGVEFPGNQPALQADFPGVTAHVSADLADHEILLTWINSGLHPALIPNEKFTFDLHPAGGQHISAVTFDAGFPGIVVLNNNQVMISYAPFALGSAASTFAHYSISFISVPEPGTYLLLGTMSLIALFAARRREDVKKLA